ncbi:unnamed protein product [Owenia fusiformis]|uniref:C2H2-type domain-containing protein n=1 Tax=Owenia fusiformis TaxID=6347 RepID=A0A8S4Q087_OWEFU|nr:unnamed protein product [Owenia fusiformis]
MHSTKDEISESDERLKMICQNETHKYKCSMNDKKMYGNEPLNQKHFKKKCKMASPSNESMVYDCDICANSFKQKGNLFRHVKETHQLFTRERKKDVQCNHCFENFDKKAKLDVHIVKEHIDVAAEKLITRHKCEICGVVTHDLPRHKKEKHRIDLNGYKCSQENCGMIARSKAELELHVLSHKGVKPFECKICGSKFRYEKNIKYHMASFHDKSRPKIGARTKTNEVTCSVCHKIFYRKTVLKNHMLTHTGRRFQCNMCEKSFSRKDVLNGHIRIQHTDTQNRYKCAKCDEGFITRFMLREHLFYAHEDFAYQCTICNFVVFTRSDKYTHIKHKHKIKHFLKEHMKLIPYKKTGEWKSKVVKCLKCKRCNLVFRYKYMFNRHSVLCKNPKSLKCQYCQHLFKNKKELESHEQYHSENNNGTALRYTCSLCKGIYITKSMASCHITLRKCPKLQKHQNGRNLDPWTVLHENPVKEKETYGEIEQDFDSVSTLEYGNDQVFDIKDERDDNDIDDDAFTDEFFFGNPSSDKRDYHADTKGEYVPSIGPHVEAMIKIEPAEDFNHESPTSHNILTLENDNHTSHIGIPSLNFPHTKENNTTKETDYHNMIKAEETEHIKEADANYIAHQDEQLLHVVSWMLKEEPGLNTINNEQTKLLD